MRNVSLNKEYPVTQDGFENNQLEHLHMDYAQFQDCDELPLHAGSQTEEDVFLESNRVECKLAEHQSDGLCKCLVDKAKCTEEQQRACLAKEFNLRKQQREEGRVG
jgi:hypothetical protein